MTGTTSELDRVIATTFADAAAFHGNLGLSPGLWKTRLLAIMTRCGKKTEDPSAATFAERLHTRDLYLATCCAERLDSAWRRFEALYQKYTQEVVRGMARTELQASDVGEGLLVDLFLPDRSGHSRIASYDGRSSLATWLHVIVSHRMANERVRKWNTVQRPGEMPEVADNTTLGDVEADMRARRYRPAFNESLRKACQTLTTRERQLLMWRYQRGLLLEDIARVLSVHSSTVCRQLERLQERLRKHVIATLADTYGFADPVIEECLRAMLENRSGSVSLLRLIGDSLPADAELCHQSAPRQNIA
jgi:RNA polymerase sigma-70 factor